MCKAVDNWPSSSTPRSVALSPISSTDAEISSCETVRLANCCRVPNHISWVLSVLSCNLFCAIYKSRCSTHFNKRAAASEAADTGCFWSYDNVYKGLLFSQSQCRSGLSPKPNRLFHYSTKFCENWLSSFSHKPANKQTNKQTLMKS